MHLFKKTSATLLFTCAIVSAFSASACQKTSKQKELAPEAKALEPVKKAAESVSFSVNTENTKVSFEMDAELEHISGKAPNSASGSLNLSLQDITKSTGLVKIDLMQLSIYQQKRESADSDFGEEVKNDTQNGHMRTWLQISDDGPKEEREKNRFIEFQIKKVESTGPSDISKMTGNKRVVALNISGELRLHGRVTSHTFPAEAVFTYEGDKISSLTVESKKPIGIDLEKHDVRPRSAFNVLAAKTLAAMGSKVAKIAQISLSLSAEAK